ncbi:MAG: DUF4242 domain-containing protein [Candidatus Aminicenantes bacterium]|nr:DUF4242 domain-containing protein [Candidatus Aminicenantes bacterium]
MPRFIAVHSVPFTEEALIKYAQEEAPKFTESGVTWIRTHCDFEDNKYFCEWEAPNKEAIEQILKDLDIPFDGIYQVRIFDVATAKLED